VAPAYLRAAVRGTPALDEVQRLASAAESEGAEGDKQHGVAAREWIARFLANGRHARHDQISLLLNSELRDRAHLDTG
jgi:hypothetical protein